MPMRWIELPAEALAKVALFQANAFKTAEPPPAQARRYLLLAVFAKQYGLPNASAYAQQAARLAPDLQTEVETIFGKEAGDKPAGTEPTR
jgi:hypothetical protein